MTAVIILNRNGKAYLPTCLDSVSRASVPEGGLRIYLVDNDSKDGSVELVRERYPDVVVIETDKNLGFSKGNNLGIERALKDGAQYCVILNNDTEVDEQLFVNLLAAGRSGDAIVSPKIYFAAGKEYHHDRYTDDERGSVIWYAGGTMDWDNVYGWHRGVNEVDEGRYRDREETEFATGCCMLLSRRVIEEVGMFDPAYFLYWEDNDLSQRAKQAGFRVLYEPLGKLWHFNAGSSGGPGSTIHNYYLTRNRLIFGMRYASWQTRLALARESVRFLFQDDMRRRAVIDFWLHRWGAGSLLNE